MYGSLVAEHTFLSPSHVRSSFTYSQTTMSEGCKYSVLILCKKNKKMYLKHINLLMLVKSVVHFSYNEIIYKYILMREYIDLTLSVQSKDIIFIYYMSTCPNGYNT